MNPTLETEESKLYKQQVKIFNEIKHAKAMLVQKHIDEKHEKSLKKYQQVMSKKLEKIDKRLQ